MTADQIVRAWKDADYGAALPHAEAAGLPAHPVGTIELADDALGLVAGGNPAGTQYMESLGCCKGITQAGYCDLTAGYPVCTMYCWTFFWTGFC
jgi:mersacidin/lichenicidin family type 2 lantibiotic